MKIATNTVVEMHYKLFGPEGELLEDTADEGPVRYRHGEAEILPGLERELEGKEAGAPIQITLDATDAYGEYNPEGLVSVPRSELPAEHEYTKGDWISVQVEADDEDGDDADPRGDDEMEMRVVEVRDTEIVLDANHPLAGRRVTFEVNILSVEQPTD